MKKSIFLLVVSIFTTILSQAQSKSSSSTSYSTAIGLKFWDGGGISFKKFLNEKNAGELIGYFNNQGFRATGLYEIHSNIASVDGLKWYIGPGAHIGFYNSKYGDGVFVGIDGVLGLDYKFSKAPINISVDWQPSFEFGDGQGFIGSWGGLGVRYTF